MLCPAVTLGSRLRSFRTVTTGREIKSITNIDRFPPHGPHRFGHGLATDARACELAGHAGQGMKSRLRVRQPGLHYPTKPSGRETQLQGTHDETRKHIPSLCWCTQGCCAIRIICGVIAQVETVTLSAQAVNEAWRRDTGSRDGASRRRPEFLTSPPLSWRGVYGENNVGSEILEAP